MIKPIGKRVLVEFVQIEQSTKSGIILASNTENQNVIAKIIEVGNIEIEKDTLIYINRQNAIKLEENFKDIYIVNEEDILAKIID